MMKKTKAFPRLVAVFVAMVMLFTMLPTMAATADNGDITESAALTNVTLINSTVEWYRGNRNSLTSTENNWREIAALATIGFDFEDEDFTFPTFGLADFMTAEMLNNAPMLSVLWAAEILAMIAMGEDPTDFDGRDYVAELAYVVSDKEKVETMIDGLGLFGSSIVFLALVAADEAETFEYLISNIVDGFQNSETGGVDSGWGVDVDTTAMFIIAFSPLSGNPEVDTALANARGYLVNAQQECGGFFSNPDWGLDVSPEATGLAIMAINALGECALDWTVDGDRYVTPIHSLMYFMLEDGSFKTAWSEGNTDLFATPQVFFGMSSIGLRTNFFTNLANPISFPIVEIPMPSEEIDECDNKDCDCADCDGDCDCDEACEEDCDCDDCTDEVCDEDCDCDDCVDEACDEDCDCDDCYDGSGNGGNGGNGGGAIITNQATLIVALSNTNHFAPARVHNITQGETVYSLLRRAGNLSIRTRGSVANGDIYVEAINGVEEFSEGPLSGWKFGIQRAGTNNWIVPAASSGTILVHNGDRVMWFFAHGPDDTPDDFLRRPPSGGGSTTSSQPIIPGENNDTDEDDDEDDTDSDVAEWENPFADVAEDSWYHDYVRFAYSNALMLGTEADRFSPNTNITRAMLVMILWRMEDEPVAVESSMFYDVADGRLYSDAIHWAAENGIVRGFAGMFEPHDNITREQFALILYNYLESPEVENVDEVAEAFADWEDVSFWAEDAVAWAAANGIIGGRTATTLAPQGFATRAEAAAILSRFLAIQSEN